MIIRRELQEEIVQRGELEREDHLPALFLNTVLLVVFALLSERSSSSPSSSATGTGGGGESSVDMMAWACAFSLLMFFFMFVVKVSLQFTTAISTTSSRSDASAWGTDRGSGGESSPARWHPSVKGIPRIYREIGYSVECSLEVFPRTSFVASFADGVICLHLYSHNPHWNLYRFCIRDRSSSL